MKKLANSVLVAASVLAFGSPAASASTLPLSGSLDAVAQPPGFTGFDGAGSTSTVLGGSVSFGMTAGQGCLDLGVSVTCPVTAIELTFDGAPLFSQDPAVDTFEVDIKELPFDAANQPFSIDGQFALGSQFGLIDVVLRAGEFTAGAAELALLDASTDLEFATGNLRVTPVPAALPLLASALAATGLVRWRRKNRASAAA